MLFLNCKSLTLFLDKQWSVSVATVSGLYEIILSVVAGITSMLLKVSDRFVDYSLSSLCHLKANILIFLNKVGRAGRKPVFITLVIKHSRLGLLMCMSIIWSF